MNDFQQNEASSLDMPAQYLPSSQYTWIKEGCAEEPITGQGCCTTWILGFGTGGGRIQPVAAYASQCQVASGAREGGRGCEGGAWLDKAQLACSRGGAAQGAVVLAHLLLHLVAPCCLVLHRACQGVAPLGRQACKANMSACGQTCGLTFNLPKYSVCASDCCQKKCEAVFMFAPKETIAELCKNYPGKDTRVFHLV